MEQSPRTQQDNQQAGKLKSEMGQGRAGSMGSLLQCGQCVVRQSASAKQVTAGSHLAGRGCASSRAAAERPLSHSAQKGGPQIDGPPVLGQVLAAAGPEAAPIGSRPSGPAAIRALCCGGSGWGGRAGPAAGKVAAAGACKAW